MRAIFIAILCLLSHCYSFESPLFISLGANCTPAARLRDFQLRQAALPLDWMLSVDDAGLIKLIDRDFEDFANEKYLVNAPDGHIFHTLYHIEFLADHELGEGDLISKIQAKYPRRIERLRQIAYFEGKVFFIRFILPSRLYKQDYPAAYWFDYSHEKNEKEVAIELRDALKKRFPQLNFDLIIVSKTDIAERMEIVEDVTLFYVLNEFNLPSWEAIFNNLKARQ